MKKYDLSKIMKRAWELVKEAGLTISSGLKKAWKEAKTMKTDLVDELKANLENMMYSNYHINLGIDRQVCVKELIKGDVKRKYLSISCFTMNGRFKGSYKCGYVDLVTNEYVCGRYDDVDALNMEYIGR